MAQAPQMSVAPPQYNPNLELSSRGLPETYIGDISNKRQIEFQSRLPEREIKRIEKGIELERQLTSSPIDEFNRGGTPFFLDRPIRDIIRESKAQDRKLREFQRLTEGIEELPSEKLESRLEKLKKTGAIVSPETKKTDEGVETSYNIYFPESTIGVGIGKDKRKVPISRFDTSGEISFLGSTTGYAIERGLINLGYPEEGKTKEVKIGGGEIEQIGGTGIYNPITGEYDPQKFRVEEREVTKTVLPSARVVGDIASTGRFFIPYVGQGLFFGETTEQVVSAGGVKQFAKQKPIETALIGGTLFGGGIIRSARRLKRKGIIEGSLKGGETIKLRGIEKRIPIETEKGIRQFALFQDRVIRTPVTALVQSPLGKLIGKSPEIRKLKRGQTYILEPIDNIFGMPIEIGKPYLARLGRVGKRGDIVNQRFFAVGGKSKRIAKEEVKSLSKVEQQPFLKIAEKKTGSPIKSDEFSKFISEGEKLQKGIIRQIDLSKVGTGRATTLGIIGTKVKPIKVLESGAGTFRIDTALKDITKPLARATGKIDVERNIAIVYPTIQRETTDITKIITSGSKKTPLSKTFKLETPKQIIRPKYEIPKPRKQVTEIVEDIKPTESIWAGTGLYERTTGVGGLELSRDTQTQEIFPTTLSIQPQSQFKGTIIKTRLVQEPIIKTKLGLKSDLRLLQESKLSQKPLTRLQERTKQSQVERLATKQRARQKVREIFKTSTTTKKTITTTKTPPPPNFPKLKFPKVSDKEEELLKIVEEGDFKAFVKKGGKDISIGEFTNLPSAKKELKGELVGTLRASGFIEREGKKVKLDFGSAFRPSKKDPFIIVERKQKRIKKGSGETQEIQFFRRQRRGNLI